MFIEPTITQVPSGFSWYIWLDTKLGFEKILLFLDFITQVTQPLYNLQMDDIA